MKDTPLRWAGLMAATLGACAAAQAQTPPPPVYGELAACRAMRDVPARVACYDAIRLPAPGAAAPAAARPPEVPVTAGAVTTRVPADFGLPPKAAVAPEAQVLQSRIAGRFEGWGPGSKLRLANGQVWEVTDGSSVVYDLDAPEVSIRRGLLGSFFMEVTGVAATPRVRRVQ
jgi:hypothetical protein